MIDFGGIPLFSARAQFLRLESWKKNWKEKILRWWNAHKHTRVHTVGHMWSLWKITWEDCGNCIYLWCSLLFFSMMWYLTNSCCRNLIRQCQYDKSRLPCEVVCNIYLLHGSNYHRMLPLIRVLQFCWLDYINSESVLIIAVLRGDLRISSPVYCCIGETPIRLR